MEPVQIARTLAAFVDVLLPGDASWPSAATVGVQAQLTQRLVESKGEDALTAFIEALQSDSAVLLDDDEAARVAAVAAFETRDPDLFGWIRDAVYVAYYESPVVVLAINAHGSLYKLRPHIEGYPLPRFDLEQDMPRHGRGHWIVTAAVRRVPVEALTLTEARATKWGREQ